MRCVKKKKQKTKRNQSTAKLKISAFEVQGVTAIVSLVLQFLINRDPGRESEIDR